MSRRCVRWWSAPVLLLWLAGCAHGPWARRRVPACAGQLVSTDVMDGDFLLRQRVRVEAGGRSFALRLVTQKRGGELLQVGIDPLGAKLFTLRQRGTQVEVDALPAPVLEVEPANFLRDLHRIRFLTIDDPPADGSSSTVRDGTEIRETWERGTLRERRFRRVAGRPDGAVVLRFETPGPTREGIHRVSIANGWCGYRVEVVTLVEEPEA
jgi:hypothetical protein